MSLTLNERHRIGPISKIRTALPDTYTVGRSQSGTPTPFFPMESLSPSRIVAALALALPLVACGPSDESDRANTGPIVGPFVVSQYFTPSGLMGDGAVPGRLTVDINKNCKARPPGAQGDCYRFVYQPGDVKWAGAYWVTPANNWGTSPGRDIVGPIDTGTPDPGKPGSPNLRRYQWARVKYAAEPLPGELTLHFWTGRLDGRVSVPPQPFYDVGCSLSATRPPLCTDENQVPPSPFTFSPAEKTTVASSEWQEFKIDLSKWSVLQLIAAFGFSTNDDVNPGLTQVIYLDDIVWE